LAAVKNLTERKFVGWNFDNSYARLPELMFRQVAPAKVRQPAMAIFNLGLAKELGLDLDSLSDADLASVFAGQFIPEGGQPIAQAYAGHQYGGFTMLGDGRAILLGEQLTPTGQRYDIQFKGPGRTPFSRKGDGKAALGPMLREYIISEAMHALGIPTTRSLAVVTTGEAVYREMSLPGAILTRVAKSHIRVGTFQYLAAQQDTENLRVLADYTIKRHYSELVDAPNKYGSFFRAVVDRQAALIAKWQAVGFVHGVMNTDNMAISGETIDYGPCAFMDAYDPDTVFSSIDHGGRYAYGNQPSIAQWNLARFAETLLPLIDVDQDKAIEVATHDLNAFPQVFQRYWMAEMRAKIGLVDEEESDKELIAELLDWMHEAKSDFTNTFQELAIDYLSDKGKFAAERFKHWYKKWQQRLVRECRPIDEAKRQMQSVNPFVIPRNHRVEEALDAASLRGDLSVMHKLLAALEKPFERNDAYAEYQAPSGDSRHYRTFCGT
jgi:uncharacterized protein YdiU (UPF0061 family)